MGWWIFVSATILYDSDDYSLSDSLCAYYVTSGDPDYIARMRYLIWISTGRNCHKDGFPATVLSINVCPFTLKDSSYKQ